MKTIATAKNIGTSSRKIGLVAALIRGKGVMDAARILEQTNKRATGPVGKVLKSAIANATNNHGSKKGSLVVESVFVGPGPTLKRFMPRAKGSASSIHKRTSHITVVLTDNVNSNTETLNPKQKPNLKFEIPKVDENTKAKKTPAKKEAK